MMSEASTGNQKIVLVNMITETIKSKKEDLKSIWIDFKKIELKMSFALIIMIGVFYFYCLNLIFPF